MRHLSLLLMMSGHVNLIFFHFNVNYAIIVLILFDMHTRILSCVSRRRADLDPQSYIWLSCMVMMVKRYGDVTALTAFPDEIASTACHHWPHSHGGYGL